MRSLSSVAGPLVVRAVDLAGVGSICDVGGGTGRLLRALLDAAPAARGTVFDLPDVVSDAPEVLGDLPPDRWTTVSGSFFDAGAIPAGHDRYVMQAIMHDWGDDDAGVILGNVRDAMSSGSRLWVIDSVLDPAAVDDMSKAVDMLMLTVTEGGRERTQEEWDAAVRIQRVRHRSPDRASRAHLDLHSRAGLIAATRDQRAAHRRTAQLGWAGHPAADVAVAMACVATRSRRFTRRLWPIRGVRGITPHVSGPRARRRMA